MTTHSRRMQQKDADQINDKGRQTHPQTNKRSKNAKLAVSKAVFPILVRIKPQRSCKSDDV